MNKENQEKKIVSVCMITYNHGRYIADAIEGVLMQQTSFPVQLIIGEDTSPDNTREICEAYAAKYPDVIKLLPSGKRYGMINNFFRVMDACDGEYIAMCDGDDYWTDPNKLQLQVDFLNAHPGTTICNHALQVIDDNGKNVKVVGGFNEPTFFTFKDCVIQRQSGTASMVFRRSAFDREKLVEILKNKAHQVDWSMELLLLDKGNGCVLPYTMAVYRKHGGGITSVKEHNNPVNVVKNRLFVVEGLKQHVQRKNRKYLNSFLGILSLKAARINKENRTKYLFAGAAYLLRYPYFLFNLSKVSNRYNPF